MKRLMQKMLRDLWDFRAQFISIFLMALIGVLVYTGIEGVWGGMQHQGDAWFKKSNLADVWVSCDSLSDRNVSNIKNLKGVKNVQAAAVEDAKWKPAKKDEEETDVRLIWNKTNQISKPMVESGAAYTPNSDGCWIDQNFAAEHHIRKGSTLTFIYGDKKQKVTIRGTVLSPDYIFYAGADSSIGASNHKKYGYAFVTRKIIKALKGNTSYNQIKITVQNKTNLQDLKGNIENTLGAKYIGFFDRSDWSGVAIYTNKITQLKKMSVVFSLLFFLLALLTMQTTMKRVIETERTQIATFKALGFRNRQLYLLYASYGFVISMLGTVTALVLAPFTITPAILKMQQKFYAMPYWQGKNMWFSYAVAMIVIICCTLSAVMASRKGMAGMPAQVMRGDLPAYQKEAFLEHFPKIWDMFSFEWKWTLRGISRNRIRTITGIVGTLGSMVLLMAGFGMNDSMYSANRLVYGKQYDYSAKISLVSGATQKDRDYLYDKVNHNGQWIEEHAAEILTSQRNSRNAVLSIIQPGIFVHLQDTHGNDIALPQNKILISHQLALMLNIKRCDYLQFRVLGYSNPFIANVQDIVTTPTPQGIYLSSDTWQNLCEKSFRNNINSVITSTGKTQQETAEMTDAFKKLHSSINQASFFVPTALLSGRITNMNYVKNLSYVKGISTLNDQLKDANDILNTGKLIIYICLFAAILLSVIILYNLGVLNFTERKREYATMKVLGFHRKEIRAIIFKDCLFNTVIGWLLGWLIGLQFLKVYVGVATTDNFEYTPMITSVGFILSTCITIGTSLLVSAWVSRKVNNLDMVESLKSGE